MLYPEVRKRLLTMGMRRKNRKEELLTAAVHLIADGGLGAATVRAIARGAGVTDAAVYRHYESKDDLCWRAYNRIVREMVGEKRHLVASEAPLREKLREWVRLSYAYHDRNPDAMIFLLSMPLAAYRSVTQLSSARANCSWR